MSDDFKQLLRLLEPDNLFLPKEIVARKDISDKSKIMLGIIFTKNRFKPTDTIKYALAATTEADIAAEFGSDQKVVKRIKSDLHKIYLDFDNIFAKEVV